MKKRFDGFDEDGAAEEKAEERRLADPDVDLDSEEEASEGIPYFTVRFPGQSPLPSKSGVIRVNSQNPGPKPDSMQEKSPQSKKPLVQRISEIRTGIGSIIRKFRK